ncbi:autophagy-related protein 16-1 isoform X2 [Cyclopterus lumpus]|uniref:autophagy-related protein 16-1 isoform X2 n=1 Tax=Cyclopterus lumpus TaxID=8103 RepID=UPI001486984A|nr:autophagy-related protein 16-1 isoform X2 [Cyclopterus lumpus]
MTRASHDKLRVGKVAQLEERFEIRKQILDDVQPKSFERGGSEVGKNIRLLQLQLRESEHLEEKLSQTVSDLTTVLFLKEAELQYWQSRVSHYHQEALTLARGSNTLKATLSEFEFTIECQSKELSALRAEQKRVNEELTEAWREKEELLQRWMQEKREEADRLNKYNETQEGWQRLAKQLKKHRLGEKRKERVPIVTSSRSGETETPTSVIQRINNTTDVHQGPSDHSHVSAVAKV